MCIEYLGILLYSFFIIFITHKWTYLKRIIKKKGSSLLKKSKYVIKKKKEAVAQIKESFFRRESDETSIDAIPKTGMASREVRDVLESYSQLGSVDWKQGKISGTVYGASKELSNLVLEAFKLFQYTNPLHTDVFPGLQRMESSVVSMCMGLYKSPDTGTGSLTSGGTESILMACKTYRDMAREKWNVTDPEMVIAESAHVAFHKAAHYLGISLVKIKVDSVTRKFNVDKLRGYLNSNTILVAASAPSFPHGVIDPIERIGSVIGIYNDKNENQIGYHIDACLGGFILPFMDHIHSKDSHYNFTSPSVTSISLDTHKYGYSPKGASVILYRDKLTAQYQYFVEADWSGGIYLSPTLAGSRSGTIIAGTWATMIHLGFKGYVENTRKILHAVDYIYAELMETKHLRVLVKPDATVISFTSDDFDIYILSQLMAKKGWNLNILQFPPSLHICVTLVHTPDVSRSFITDMRICISQIMEDSTIKAEGVYGIYGSSQGIPDRSLIKEIGYEYLVAYYS